MISYIGNTVISNYTNYSLSVIYAISGLPSLKGLDSIYTCCGGQHPYNGMFTVILTDYGCVIMFVYILFIY